MFSCIFLPHMLFSDDHFCGFHLRLHSSAAAHGRRSGPAPEHAQRLVRAGLLQQHERVPARRAARLLRGRVGPQLHHRGGPEPDLRRQGLSGELGARTDLQGVGNL